MRNNLYSDDDRLYLQMMQENITRMATNSANAKTWMVTIVAAILAIECKIEATQYWLLLAIIPSIAFWYTDAYYLRLERQLRNREQLFLNVLRKIEDETDTLYDFRPLPKKKKDEKRRYVETGCQLFNKSVWPLYVVMCLIIIVVTGIINRWFDTLLS